MHHDTVAAIHECVTRSLLGAISFHEVVRILQERGIERYHADYSRHEITYYMPDGNSHVEAMGHPPERIAEMFSAAAIETAIRQSQRGEISYAEFVHKSKSAGCVGYFVQITGRRVLYFGRNGDVHVEPFPSVSK